MAQGGLISPVLFTLEIRHKLLEEHCDNLRECWAVFHQALTSKPFRGISPMGRHNMLPGSDPRYMPHLVTSHQTRQKKTAQRTGHTGPPPEKEREVISPSGMESYCISGSFAP
jgi:hypothetical protein